MGRPALYRAIFAVCGVAVLSVPATTSAQSLESLDALSDASIEESTGIQAARDQASRGEYLEALATLERVLAQNPRSREARLIHAIYLCRVDDRRGGLVEIDILKEKHYGKELLDEARAMCAPTGG